MPQIVTLLTDFGLQDTYVAEMKAILMPLPRLRIVDLTHNVPAHDIRYGAFQLLRSYRWFPKGTWHMCIVDPGVGTSRKAIYVETRNYCFVGPDNGLLLWAVKDAEKRDLTPCRAFEVSIPSGVSTTFHGRDVFARFVVSSLKNRPQKLTKIDSLSGEHFPSPIKKGREYHGEVLVCDHFGNAITSIAEEGVRDALAEVGSTKTKIKSYPSYEKIPDGKAALIRGSHGFWEIACRKKSACEMLRLKNGTKVSITPLGDLQ